ncbi:hypothetical protein [Arthrobacter sp. zg-Y1143]|uniref:hypothetical protein n=1 Tax=Arthrobacter sp. zg-Y1143 TaxID=3049065 RepID=UPI0024C3D3A3|nr:hypothetical protein [Arthrobacter sp. zg-Y1143]MDK1328286.1 hypothetical protein [Arthrobacter sp. zg-Y1143]
MQKGSIAVLLLAAALGLAGCSSSAEAAKESASAAPSPSASSSAPATPPAPPSPAPTPTPTLTPPPTLSAPAPATPAEPVTAIAIAQQLQAVVPGITSVTEVTAENDPGGFIGQPGYYTSAAWIADASAAAPENSVVGGAVVEVFASEADAQARFAQLQEHLALGAAYKREYMYLQGTALLRVTGMLGDERAALYEQAFYALGIG